MGRMATFLIFTFLSEKVLDLCKMWPPPVFVKCPRFETLWTQKNDFREFVCMSVCGKVSHTLKPSQDATVDLS